MFLCRCPRCSGWPRCTRRTRYSPLCTALYIQIKDETKYRVTVCLQALSCWDQLSFVWSFTHCDSSFKESCAVEVDGVTKQTTLRSCASWVYSTPSLLFIGAQGVTGAQGAKGAQGAQGGQGVYGSVSTSDRKRWSTLHVHRYTPGVMMHMSKSQTLPLRGDKSRTIC